MRRTPKLKLKLKLVRRQHDATFVDRRKAYACFKIILLLLQGSPLLFYGLRRINEVSK